MLNINSCILSIFQSAIAASVKLQSHLELRLNEQGIVNIDLPAVGVKRSWSVIDIEEAVKLSKGTCSMGQQLYCNRLVCLQC